MSRAGRHGLRCLRRRTAARSRRRRRPRGVPRSGRPRPPRPARSAGSVATSPAAAAWWASTLGSPPIASSASIIAACSAGSDAGRGRLQDRGPGDLMTECHPASLAVDQAGGGQHPDRRRRHVQRIQQLPLTGSGVQDSSSRPCPADGAKPAIRASTASRTLSGSGDSGWARIWLTKNGFPRSGGARRPASSPCPSSSVGDRRPAQRSQLEPARVGDGDQVAQHRAQRMVGANASR